LSSIDLGEKRIISPVELVLMVFIEVFIWIINSVIDRVQEFVLWSFPTTIEGNCFLIIESVELKSCGFLPSRKWLIPRLGEVDLHALIETSSLIVH
jgi:hypothetical protein